MRFSIAAPALLSTLALAAPAEQIARTTTEVDRVDSLSIVTNNGVPQQASFIINPAGQACTGNTALELEKVVSCGSGNYSFLLDEVSVSTYNLTLYKALVPFYGISGKVTFKLYCEANGGGPESYDCLQGSDDISVTLSDA